MKSTFGKLLIAAVIAVTAAVVIPVTANEIGRAHV